MARFTYANNVSSKNALYQSLVTEGVFDAAITINGEIHISTEVGSRAQCDTAINNASSGTLLSNKTDRITEVNENTLRLINIGVDNWAAQKVALSKNDADNYFTDFEYYSAHPEKLKGGSPYIVFTLDGRASMTSNISDIETLSENAADRLIYLYSASSNTDGSKGEISLIQDILACTTQEQLDLIEDNRK